MYTVRWVAANHRTKPIDLGCESAENWLLSSTSTIATVTITQPVGWYSFYSLTEGGRLSRPGYCTNCSKGAQPVPKAVYRRAGCDKHNCPRCDSNLGPLTSQSDGLTTRLPWPVNTVNTSHILCYICALSLIICVMLSDVKLQYLTCYMCLLWHFLLFLVLFCCWICYKSFKCVTLLTS